VINTQDTSKHLGPIEIVYGQYRTTLIFVLQKCKPSSLASVFVARHVEVDDFTVLGEDANDIAFAEIIWQAADKNVRAVFVLSMPGAGFRESAF